MLQSDNMAKDLLIGSHVGMNAPDYYLGSVVEALSYKATALMFYTGAPQNSYRKPLEGLKIDEGRALLAKHGIDENNVFVHAPYIVNLASATRMELLETSIKVIINELRRTSTFGVKTFILHPGNHLEVSEDLAIQTLASSLDKIFANDGTEVKIALETMAGKGSEIGTNFASIRKIIDLCHYPERLGVCFDTCHANDAGYDVHDVDALLKEFDEVIGLNRLLVVHLNDSRNIRGAHKDRHENIGYGEIGFKTLCAFANHSLLKAIPKILETPYVNEKAPYALEIQMLRDEKFIENWKENL